MIGFCSIIVLRYVYVLVVLNRLGGRSAVRQSGSQAYLGILYDIPGLSQGFFLSGIS